VGLSLAVISPTVTAAFNITLLVQAAGPAAPLTFAIGMVAMALVALSFMAFTHRVAHAGSAYAYVTHTFGSRAGFIAGWTLLLTYIGFATGFAALVGSFTSAALKGLGIDISWMWLAIASVALIIAWWLAYRDMRLSGRLMLAFEVVAVLGILLLCALILRQVHPTLEQTLTTFRPSKEYGSWSGLGFGMVFSILCFAGFEGAATLGEETVNPRRNIPIALLGTVIFSGFFFAFVAYCEVLGYGFSQFTGTAGRSVGALRLFKACDRPGPCGRDQLLLGTAGRYRGVGTYPVCAGPCRTVNASGRCAPDARNSGGRGFLGRDSHHCPVCALGAVCQCRRLL
jgi:amino acid transporter